MHGRKKSDLPSTQEEKDAIQTKIANYKKVVTAIRHKRTCNDLDEEYKNLLGKLLRLHPDYYSMWNYRREAVRQEALQIADSEGGPEALEHLYRGELTLSVDCIKRNPKSYCAWHHHQWALEKGLDFLGGSAALRAELALCKELLDLDGRNFHCWAYRMWVSKRANVPAVEDFDFTTAKIMQNFSNYSAFHVRSKVLPRLLIETGRNHWQVLDEELDFSHQAMFTEPADQSVWWYHHFLLSWAQQNSQEIDKFHHYEDVLRREISTLEELVELEGRCKWAELALLLVTQRLADCLSDSVDTMRQARRQEQDELRLRVRSMAARLSELDPSHQLFYTCIHQGTSSVWGKEVLRQDG